jgi:hypothetical protein
LILLLLAGLTAAGLARPQQGQAGASGLKLGNPLWVVHWLCDWFWLEVLSRASYKGATLLGPRGQRLIILASTALMAGFGAWFLVDAMRGLVR